VYCRFSFFNDVYIANIYIYMCIIYHDPHVVASLGFLMAKPWRQQLAGPPSDATTGKGLRTLLDWGMDGNEGNGWEWMGMMGMMGMG
jgi:hypothetical protein